jgi:hypothetical protein
VTRLDITKLDVSLEESFQDLAHPSPEKFKILQQVARLENSKTIGTYQHISVSWSFSFDSKFVRRCTLSGLPSFHSESFKVYCLFGQQAQRKFLKKKEKEVRELFPLFLVY